MNTKASVAYGWGILCLAGGGAYYFAKRSINSDRAERAMAEEQRRQRREHLRGTQTASKDSNIGEEVSQGVAKALGGGNKGRAPNVEKHGNADPAPVEHAHTPGSGAGSGEVAPVGHAEEPVAKGKFEAKEPWRSRKGDRFS